MKQILSKFINTWLGGGGKLQPNDIKIL